MKSNFLRIFFFSAYDAYFATIDTLPPLLVPLPGRPPIAIPLFLGHTLTRWP